MKKLIAILIAMALCLSVMPAAFAAEVETEVAVLNWADFEEALKEAEMDGGFYALEDLGIVFWVPDVMAPVDAPEDANTYLGFFATEDQKAVLAVSITEPNEALTAEAFAQALEAEENVVELDVVVVNDLLALVYTVDNADGSAANVASFVCDNGSVLNFVFNAGNEGYEALSAIIVASIQAAA